MRAPAFTFPFGVVRSMYGPVKPAGTVVAAEALGRALSPTASEPVKTSISRLSIVVPQLGKKIVIYFLSGYAGSEPGSTITGINRIAAEKSRPSRPITFNRDLFLPQKS